MVRQALVAFIAWAGSNGGTALAGAAPARAEASDIRTEVPIRQVTLSDGTIRYWIPLKIGDTDVEALLDTGTTGLRILPLSGEAESSGPPDRISFGSGAELVGHVSSGIVTIGGLSGPIPFQQIEQVRCSSGRLHCPATGVPFDRYGLGADGLPGQGFQALIGIEMGSSGIANPLIAVGAKRWIVILPEPHSALPGKLVINPSDNEVSGYTPIPLLWQFRHSEPLHDAIAGCLRNLGGGAEACGAMTLDTGYPALDIINGPIGTRLGGWPRNSKAELTIFDGTELRATVTFDTGAKDNASEIFSAEHGWRTGTLIFAGVMPYLAFDVLYDPARNAIGLKPRAAAAGLPAGEISGEAR